MESCIEKMSLDMFKQNLATLAPQMLPLGIWMISQRDSITDNKYITNPLHILTVCKNKYHNKKNTEIAISQVDLDNDKYASTFLGKLLYIYPYKLK